MANPLKGIKKALTPEQKEKATRIIVNRHKSGQDAAATNFVTDMFKKAMAGDPQKTVKASPKAFYEKVPEATKLKKEFQKEQGLPTAEPPRIKKLNVERSKRIADAFEEMKHAPNDPKVKAAYDALARETVKQYQKLLDAGIEFDYWRGRGEPYKSSREMADDIRDNRKLKVLATEGNFGQKAITPEELAENPLLRRTQFTDANGNPLLVNDIFRAVHDYFGHGSSGTSFGAIGEEGAWAAHMKMYSPEARKALTTETRGQNSWVNFGKQLRRPDGTIPQKGDIDYIPPTERPFGEQKVGLLPEDFTQDEYFKLWQNPKFRMMARRGGFAAATTYFMLNPEDAEGAGFWSAVGAGTKAVPDVNDIIRNSTERVYKTLEGSQIIKADPVTALGMKPHPSDAYVNYDNLIRFQWLKPENLNNPKMVKAAVTEYRKRWDKSPSFQRTEKLASPDHDIVHTGIGKIIVEPEVLENKPITTMAGDRSRADLTINSYRGVQLERPLRTHGGGQYPFLHGDDKGYIWESVKGAATGTQSTFDNLAKRFDTDDIYALTSLMDDAATDFSIMPAQLMLDYARNNPAITKKSKDFFNREFNKFIVEAEKKEIAKLQDSLSTGEFTFNNKNKGYKKGEPVTPEDAKKLKAAVKGLKEKIKNKEQFVGIDDPRAFDQILGEGDFAKEGSGAMRKLFVEFMSKKGRGEGQYNFRDMGFAQWDEGKGEMGRLLNLPDYEGAETGDMGFAIVKPEVGAETVPDPQTESYTHALKGSNELPQPKSLPKLKGGKGFSDVVPPEFTMPSHMRELRTRLNSEGEPLSRSEAIGTFRLRNDTGQIFDAEAVEATSTYLQILRGIKETRELPAKAQRAIAKAMTEAKVYGNGKLSPEQIKRLKSFGVTSSLFIGINGILGLNAEQTHAAGFYSGVKAGLENITQMKGTPQQFKAMLKKQKGVSGKELDAIDFDKLGTKPVTKEELGKFVEEEAPKVIVKQRREGEVDDEELGAELRDRASGDIEEKTPLQDLVRLIKNDLDIEGRRMTGASEDVIAEYAIMNNRRNPDNPILTVEDYLRHYFRNTNSHKIKTEKKKALASGMTEDEWVDFKMTQPSSESMPLASRMALRRRINRDKDLKEFLDEYAQTKLSPEERQDAFEIVQHDAASSEMMFSQMRLGGGDEPYGEIYFNLESRPKTYVAFEGGTAEKAFSNYTDAQQYVQDKMYRGENVYGSDLDAEITEYGGDIYDTETSTTHPSATQPNNQAWVRYTERKGENGERILMIEEMQSDAAKKTAPAYLRKMLPKTWKDGVFNKLLEIAQEQGFDGVAWSRTGQQVNEIEQWNAYDIEDAYILAKPDGTETILEDGDLLYGFESLEEAVEHYRSSAKFNREQATGAATRRLELLDEDMAKLKQEHADGDISTEEYESRLKFMQRDREIDEEWKEDLEKDAYEFDMKADEVQLTINDGYKLEERYDHEVFTGGEGLQRVIDQYTKELPAIARKLTGEDTQTIRTAGTQYTTSDGKLHNSYGQAETYVEKMLEDKYGSQWWEDHDAEDHIEIGDNRGSSHELNYVPVVEKIEGGGKAQEMSRYLSTRSWDSVDEAKDAVRRIVENDNKLNRSAGLKELDADEIISQLDFTDKGFGKVGVARSSGKKRKPIPKSRFWSVTGGVGAVGLAAATAPEPVRADEYDDIVRAEQEKLIDLLYTGDEKTLEAYQAAFDRGEVNAQQYKYVMEGGREEAEKIIAAQEQESVLPDEVVTEEEPDKSFAEKLADRSETQRQEMMTESEAVVPPEATQEEAVPETGEEFIFGAEERQKRYDDPYQQARVSSARKDAAKKNLEHFAKQMIGAGETGVTILTAMADTAQVGLGGLTVGSMHLLADDLVRQGEVLGYPELGNQLADIVRPKATAAEFVERASGAGVVAPKGEYAQQMLGDFGETMENVAGFAGWIPIGYPKYTEEKGLHIHEGKGEDIAAGWENIWNWTNENLAPLIGEEAAAGVSSIGFASKDAFI